jgi:hypothetical protein
MTWGMVAVAGATLVAGVYSADQQSKAANKAAGAQQGAAQAGMDQQNQRFDAVQKLLAPYQQAGIPAIKAQGDLAGTNGPDAQAAAIAALQQSPAYTSQLQAGNNNILANASATGGLRGGNTEAALAQFSPSLLASTINDQYARLGGLTSIGQNAAAMTGNAGMQTGNNITNLLQQQGAAQAGGYLADGRAQAGYANAVSGAVGAYAGMGGFKSTNDPVYNNGLSTGSSQFGWKGSGGF